MPAYKSRAIALVLGMLMILSFALTACGKGSDSPTENNTTPDIPTPKGTNNTPDTAASDFEYHNDTALGGMVITKYTGKSDTVKVPETIDGQSVVKVEDSTFQNCGTLVSITTLYLGGYFASDVTITKDGDEVTSILSEERGLFNGCDSLENLTVIVPGSVKKIDDYAFMDCKQLTDVVMSDSVAEIGDGIFWFCNSLESVTMPYNGATLMLTELDDGSVYFKELFQGCDSLENVTVFIPDSVTKIDDEAFAYFHELTDVTIPESVTEIGENVFAGCTSLKNVSMYYHGGIFFDSHVSDNGVGPGGQFWDCDLLENLTVIIADGVMKIENSAFVYSQITDIIIPDSVTYIGDNAFGACESLVNINIPGGVTYIGYSAFSECRSLKKITVPDSITAIGLYAFQSCDSLESVTTGNGITAIDNAMFNNLKSLATVTIGNNVTTIGDGAFLGCESLESVNIPNGVQVIGATAFGNCKALTSVAIPDSVTEIGAQAFDGIPDLTATYKGKTYKSEEKTSPGQEDSKYYIMPDEFYDAINNGQPVT